MIARKLKSLRSGWQAIALLLCLAGVGLLGYRLWVERPQGIEVGSDLITAYPRCEHGSTSGRHHYRAANFDLYYYSEGCAKLDGSIAISTIAAIGAYDKSISAFGLPHLQSDTAALLVPGARWHVLGTPGVGRGIVIGVERRRDTTQEAVYDYEVGRPLAAAMLSEASPGLPEKARDQVAAGLAAAAAPEAGSWRSSPGWSGGLYAKMIVTGYWPEIRDAVNACRKGCDFEQTLDGYLRESHKAPLKVLRRTL